MTRAPASARRETQMQQAEKVLVEAGNVLASSLDYEQTLAAVAQLAVRSLADFCVIDVMEDGELKRVQVAHADPEMSVLTEELLGFPLDRRRHHLALVAADTREPVLVPVVTEDLIEALSQGEEHRRIISALRPRSMMAIPLLARDHLLGVVLFVSSSRSYDRNDLALAVKLVQLAGLEVDNARLYREARRALLARDRVLGIVAHDLRNPLNVIVMSGEMLLSGVIPENGRTAQVEMIRRSAKRMNRLIQDLLDVAKIEADRLFLQRDIQDAARLAKEAVEINASLAAAKSLTLVCARSEGRLPPVLADRDRILQVLSNLIGNAIRFTPEGGTIEVRVEWTEEGAHITVADTGPGIAPENLPMLFQPFWQAQRGSLEGAGLGLMIARGIVEAHGGRIWAETAQGVGSTFHFTIPPDVPSERADRRSATPERRVALQRASDVSMQAD